MDKRLVRQVSEELNLPEDVVSTAYQSFWEYIRVTISGFPLKEEITEEEFNKLKVNFNIPSIGKLHCDYNRLVGIKEKYKKKLDDKD